MAVNINRLTNANVYADGGSLLGQAMEIDLPTVTYKQADHAALGMIGSIETFAGIDKMEATIRWTAPYPDAIKKFANPFQSIALQVRGNLETYTSAGRTDQQPYIVYMTVMSKGQPAGNMKQHENVEMENTLNVLYLKIEINGESVLEVDPLAQIYKVDGQDLLQAYKTNLGL